MSFRIICETTNPTRTFLTADMKKRIQISPISQIASILLLILTSSCSQISDSTMNFTIDFPVSFDPRYSFKIQSQINKDHNALQVGDLLEMEGALIYHEVNEAVLTEIPSDVKWFASLYPYGQPVSEESIQLTLRKIQDGSTHKLDWQIDNDDVLLVVSDEPMPANLFLAPTPGDTRIVCVEFTIQSIEWIEDVEQSFISMTLVPNGEFIGGLIHSNLHDCHPTNDND